MSKALIKLLDSYSELLAGVLDLKNDQEDLLTRTLIDLDYTQTLINKGLLR